MRLHVVQHVPFEGPAAIAEWAEERGHAVSSALALTEQFPDAADIDFLVIMGGPMAADDEGGNPWLHAEKHFIAAVIAAGKPVLGVCLGAQILAETIGGAVRRNPHREIGWYAVTKTPTGAEEPLFAQWPEYVVVGQWHGDTFDLPDGLQPCWSSEACRNQAFVFDGRVVGLQFHLEWTDEALAALLGACGDELGAGGLYEMSAEQIEEEQPERLASGRELLFELLDDMAAVGSGLAGDEGR